MEITIDNWTNSRCKEEICHISSSFELLELLEKLDAKQHTLVNIFISEQNYLMIGGGEGKYIVTGEENNMIFNLINSNEKSTQGIELNAGGQYGLFEPKYILSKEMAFECVMEYFSTGLIPQNDNFFWEKY